MHMGASGWRYHVDYDANIGAALERLRDEVFASGQYVKEEVEGAGLSEAEYRAQIDQEYSDQGVKDFLMEEWHEARDRPPITTPDELLAAQPESGTHSIIDMAAGVNPEPAAFAVAPLTPHQLEEFFGSERPTREAVDTWLDSGGDASVRDRWEGLYVVTHTDSVPTGITFAGASGD